MKVLLILPDTKGSFDVYKQSFFTKALKFLYAGFNAGNSVYIPPLGPLTIAACTPEHFDVQIVDEKVDGEVDFETDTDLVGISVSAHSACRGYQLADEFRKRGRKVVLGGFHVSSEPREALEHADAVVVGEAESVWNELLKDAKSNGLKKVYRGDEFLPLDGAPFPRWDLMDTDRYMLRHVIQATRGCPFTCEFCSVASFFGGSFRAKPVKQVLRELGPLKRGDFVCFVDDNIVGSPSYAEDLFRALIPLKIKWISQASITIANDNKLLKLAAESGCVCLLIGIETVEPANAEYMQDKYTPHLIEEQIGRIHEAGIGINGTFMLGLDGDTPKTFERTADFCIKNSIELPTFNVYSPIPGTPMFNRMRSEARLKPDGYREYEELLLSRKLFFTLKGMSETEFYEGFDRMCRTVFSYKNILNRNRRYRISLKEYLYANFVWRQSDLQLGRRSLSNLQRPKPQIL
jgi:radical SAM superfamily enzyme YgiQ (UPF0313 family)